MKSKSIINIFITMVFLLPSIIKSANESTFSGNHQTHVSGPRDTSYNQVVINEDFSVYIPNAFTPNKDNLNDTFGPYGVEISDTGYELILFTRNGEKIFESHDLEDRWNGTFNGELVDTNTYVYMLKCKFANSDKAKFYLGHVTVIR